MFSATAGPSRAAIASLLRQASSAWERPARRFDAEVIAVACRILRRLGISSHSLKIGNIGVFRDLLPSELDSGDRARVIGHLDRLISIDDKCRLLSKTLSKNDDAGLIEDLNLDRMELAALQQQADYSGPRAIEHRPRLSAGEYAELLPQEAEATFRRVWSVESLIPHDTADLLLRVSRLRGSLAEVHQEGAGDSRGYAGGRGLRGVGVGLPPSRNVRAGRFRGRVRHRARVHILYQHRV